MAQRLDSRFWGSKRKIRFLNLTGEVIPAYCPIVYFNDDTIPFSFEDATLLEGGRLAYPVYGSLLASPNGMVAINGPFDIQPDAYGEMSDDYPLPCLIDPDSFTIWDGTADGDVSTGDYQEYQDSASYDLFPPLGVDILNDNDLSVMAANFRPHSRQWTVLTWDVNPDGSQATDRVIVAPYRATQRYVLVFNDGGEWVPPHALLWSDQEGGPIAEQEGVEFVPVTITIAYDNNVDEYTASSDPGTIWYLNSSAAIAPNDWGLATRDCPALALIDDADFNPDNLESVYGPVIESWGIGQNSFVNIFNPIGLSAFNDNLVWVTNEIINSATTLAVAANNAASGTLAEWIVTKAGVYQIFFSCSVNGNSGNTASFGLNWQQGGGSTGTGWMGAVPAALVSWPQASAYDSDGDADWKQVCFGGLVNASAGDTITAAVSGSGLMTQNGLLWGVMVTIPPQ